MRPLFETGCALLVVGSCMALGGCNQYWERKDTISFAAGNAVSNNAALQIPDPWPRGAYDTNILSNGDRAQRAIERYRLQGSAAAPQGNQYSNSAPAPAAGPTPSAQ